MPTIVCLHPMGVHVNETLNAQSADPIKFILSVGFYSSIYYKIDGLLLVGGTRQETTISISLYIYDRKHKLENRLSKSEILDRELIEKI